MVDPVLLRRGIAETIGTFKKWNRSMLRTFTGLEPTINAKAVRIPLRAFLDHALDLITRDLFLSWFKPMVVIRPAYVLRVVGLEEQSRFLATMGVGRRMAAGKILSGERAAEFLEGGARARASIAARGIGPDDVDDALRFMAARDPDRASIVNRIGFNQEDSALGHRLAAKLERGEVLTDAERADALNMLTKYRRQLAEMEVGGPLGEFGKKLAERIRRAGEQTVEIDVTTDVLPAMLPETQVVNEAGVPIRTYHGTGTPFERYDPTFSAQEALYGPGIYSTESAEVAGGYAQTIGGKSLRPQFFNTDRAAAEEFAQRNGVPLKGDPTEAGWFERVDARDGNTYYYVHVPTEGTPNVRYQYLDIRNPFRIDAQIQRDDLVRIFNAAAERTRPAKLRPGSSVEFGEDQFGTVMRLETDDVGNVTAVDVQTEGAYVEDVPVSELRFGPGIAENMRSNLAFFDSLSGESVYRSLVEAVGNKAEVRKILESAGYDGITHIGGKITGGQPHRVWIAFREEQVIPGFERVAGGPVRERFSLTFGRPGFLPDEALANNISSRFALATPGPVERAVREALSPSAWGAVERTDPHFVDWWYNALAHQFGLDEIGHMYLDDIARGVDEERSVAKMTEFLTSPGDGLRYAKRIMGPEYTREALELQVRRGVRYARDLTREHPELAGAARDGLLTPEMLLAIPDAERPLLVHGPLISESVLARVGPLKRGRDFAARWILQEPTNRLSRQPYFKAWYDRMHRSLIDTALANDLEMTPELLRGIEASAREFAVGQSRRIMFDFTREGRVDQLTRHFLMFVQPFLEFPVVWGRIIRQNPAMVWHFNRLGRMASESGLIRTDPETGELTVPTSWWAGAAPLLAAVTGGNLKPVGSGGGWELSVPLSGFNLFAQSTFQLPTGHFAGELPIFMPSFNPEAMWAMQQLVNHSDVKASVKARISSWLFAFGPVDPAQPSSLLPSYLHHGLAAIFPQWFESETNLQQTHFLQVQQAMGIDPDPDLAREQARKFSGLRAFFALVFPGAPRIEFPTVELEREWRTYVDQAPDYSSAREAFLKAHPGLDLITLARTMWSEENDSPIPIPASQAVNELLNGKGAKKFAEQHPAWVWAIIPHELREGTIDAGSFFSQIASGQRVALTPEQFLEKGAVQQGWDTYFAVNEGWVAWQEAHPLLGEGDPPYTEAKLDYQETIEHIGEMNPAWHAEFGTIDTQGVDPRVLAEARRLAADPMFTRTDTGKWLVGYLEVRDKAATELAKVGLHSIETMTAERLGITKDYNQGVRRLNQLYPDGLTAYRLFFQNDLKKVTTAGDKLLNNLPEGLFDAKITPWWEEFEKLRQGPDAAATEAERSAAFTSIRAYVELAYDSYDKRTNPLILRWKTSDPTWRQDYLISSLSRPYAYQSWFDKTQLLKDRTDKATEAIWTAYGDARGIIAQREATDPDYSSTAAYDALGKWVAAQAATHKRFAGQLAHANRWTFTFGELLPQILPDRSHSGPYWTALLDATDEVQRVVDGAKLGGSFDARHKVAYNILREHLLKYVGELRATSAEFDEQWTFLEDASGADPLLSYLMPEFDTYFGPIQGYPGED